MSSPGGEETGEGELNTDFHHLPIGFATTSHFSNSSDTLSDAMQNVVSKQGWACRAEALAKAGAMQNAQTLLALSRRDIRYIARSRKCGAGYSSHYISSPAGTAESFRKIRGHKPKQGKTRLDKTKQAFSEKVFFFTPYDMQIHPQSRLRCVSASLFLCGEKLVKNKGKPGENRPEPAKKTMPKPALIALAVTVCVLDCGSLGPRKLSGLPLLVFGSSLELGCWFLVLHLCVSVTLWQNLGAVQMALCGTLRNPFYPPGGGLLAAQNFIFITP